MQINTSGGDIDTDVNELIVNPCGAPLSSLAVATATPVANCPQACRNFASVIADWAMLDKAVTSILS